MMSRAKPTHAALKAVRVEAKNNLKKFGAKSDKSLTTAKYVYYLTDNMKALIDEKTLAALIFGIEACYKEFGPLDWLYKLIQRDGASAGVFDHCINATGLAEYFPVRAGGPPSTELLKFVQHKDFKHNVNHIVRGDQLEFERVVSAITKLSSAQLMFVLDNAEKLTAGVAVPVFYYKVENGAVYISPTRFLDHPKNVAEAQYKLANGLTKNRPWYVRFEHREVYAILEAEWEADKRKKQQEEDELYAKYGEPERNEPEALAQLLAAVAFKHPEAKPEIEGRVK